MKQFFFIITGLLVLFYSPLRGQTSAIAFYVDTVQYQNSQNIYRVPIRVKNFTNVRAFQFSLVITNTKENVKLDSINSTSVLPGLNSNNYNVYNDSTVYVLWDQTQSTGITLADNTVIFELVVRLSGSQGECVNFAFRDDPVEIIALKGNSDQGIIPLTIGGDICIRKYISLSGLIVREDSLPISKVNIHCSSNDSTYLTDASGRFIFKELRQDSNHLLRPRRDDNLTNGVNVRDIVQTTEHILLKKALNSPTKIIAADVDKSGSVNVVDIALMRDAILTKITRFPNNTSWRFIPLNYRFKNPKSPLAEAFPEFLLLKNQTQDIKGIKFIGIKIGDVDLSASTQ